MKPRNPNSVYNWNKIETTEILKIIKSDILTNKSSGYDDLPAQLIKWCAQHLAPILANIFNRFINLGLYPNLLKIAKVVIAKVENYRPISVLSHLNKIFEKCIHQR